MFVRVPFSNEPSDPFPVPVTCPWCGAHNKKPRLQVAERQEMPCDRCRNLLRPTDEEAKFAREILDSCLEVAPRPGYPRQFVRGVPPRVREALAPSTFPEPA